MTDPSTSKAPTADELAYGTAGLGKAVIEPPKPAAPVRYLTDKKRVERVELQWPFAVGDLEYRAVTLKRLTGGEVAAFSKRMAENPDAEFRFPIYFDERNVELSDDVWEALDDDDRYAIVKAADDFLPARFRVLPPAPEAPGSSPPTGDTSGSSSPA